MFINLVVFPPIREGKDEAFRDWFAWTNSRYAEHKGFIRRRLLEPREGGTYAAVVEHESYETFMDMHTSPTRAEAFERVKDLLDGSPTPAFYEVIQE